MIGRLDDPVFEPADRGLGLPSIPVRFAVWLLDGYKRWLSPFLPRSCRFSPSCSEYSRLAIVRHGLARGIALTSWRLARCQPFARGGVDLP